jgi:peptide deformylase
MLDIISAPNEVLSQNAKEVEKIDESIIKLLKDMEISLNSATDPIGVGLAAPQIGRSLRIFIAKPTLKSKLHVFINPKIIKLSAPQKKKSEERTRKLEGCLSLPNIWGEVLRYDQIFLEYEDEKGEKHEKLFKGFLATIIQHEVDHLDGILFPKRVLEQKGTLYKSEKNEKGEDVFEELAI